MNETMTSDKPRQGIAGLWNISFGFFGIQIGFALQNANMSRIFQSLGSSLDDLPALWIAAPLTGLLVQPIVGHLSDKTWLGRLGRRRPYFVAGAVLAALALVLMPLSTQLLMAAVLTSFMFLLSCQITEQSTLSIFYLYTISIKPNFVIPFRVIVFYSCYTTLFHSCSF